MALFNKQSSFFSIETSRLLIRPYRQSDFSNSLTLYSNPISTRFFDHGKPKTRQEICKLIKNGCLFFKTGKPYGIFSIFIKGSDQFIGQLDFLPTKNSQIIEIGYILDPNWQNQGYGSEAVTFFLNEFIKKIKTLQGSQKIVGITATVHPNNIASQKILEKIGMHFEKFEKRFGKPRKRYFLNLINT